jgi:hypothetical protein
MRIGLLSLHTATYPDNPSLGFCGTLTLLVASTVRAFYFPRRVHDFLDENLKL